MTMGFYVPTNNDVKFPKACEHCHFYDGLLCCVLDTYIHDPENKQEDCPLVPVPPHGRLIEDTAVREQIDEWLGSVGDVVVGHGLSYYGELLGCIEDAPTIIPAEEED